MSDDKVVNLLGQAISGQVAQPNEQVIAACEHLLEQARRGHLQGIVAAMAYSDDCAGWSRAGGYTLGMIGAVEEVKYLLIQDLSSQ